MKTSTRNGIIVLLIVIVVIIIISVFNKRTQNQTVTPEPLATVSYVCNQSKTITAAFYEGKNTSPVVAGQPPVPSGSAKVSLSDGRNMTLPQTISADGVRYATADDSFVFWSKGNGALVLENNTEKSYIGCVRIADQPTGSTFDSVYAPTGGEFSLRLPLATLATSTSIVPIDSYTINESYRYGALGPKKEIYGVQFTIPRAMATGTNLSNDTYLSIEEIPQAAFCSANLFTYTGAKSATTTEGGVTYSVATSSDAGLGNRYEETVYAIPGTNPCIAIRYFIHYGAFGNYPPGMVKEFDKQAVLSAFDAIRKTLIINQ